MARSRAWRVAEFLGLVEDPARAPRAGSRAWAVQLLVVGCCTGVVALVAALLH